jgi:trimethylamine--corrinoid protein Co-methyltransferase
VNRAISQCSYFRILTPEQVEEVHGASLAVLEKNGVLVEHQEGLRMLEAAGAQVDYASRRARFPEELVERCLATVPTSITLAARNPEKDLIVEHGCLPVSRNGGGSDYTLDLDTDEFRPLTIADLKDYIRLMDGLAHIHFVAPVYAQDLPVVGRDVRVLEIMFANTDKHVHMRAYSKRSLGFLLRMACTVAGGRESLKRRPMLSLLEAPVSPLTFLDITVDALLMCGEYGVPVELCCMPIAGGTGPMTLGGNVMLANAELLACVVISQLANPGAPLEFAPRCMIMDMRTTVGLTGSMEGAMMAAAGAQMAREKYNVPVSLHGPWTDSMLPDGQSDLERTNFTFMAGMAGANVLSGAGMIEQGKTFSHVQLAIDDDVLGMLELALGGILTAGDHLAVEAIDRAGPGGNFLMDDLTLKDLRHERFFPQLMTRQTREEWTSAGSKDLRERARDRVRQILANHEPVALDEDVARELASLVRAAEQTLRSEGS